MILFCFADVRRYDHYPERPLFATPFQATFYPGVNLHVVHSANCSVVPFEFGPDLTAYLSPEVKPNPYYLTEVAQAGLKCPMNLYFPLKEMPKSPYAIEHARCRKIALDLRDRAHLFEYACQSPRIYREICRSIRELRQDAVGWRQDGLTDFALSTTGGNARWWGVNDLMIAAALNWLPLTEEKALARLDIPGQHWRKAVERLRLVRYALFHPEMFTEIFVERAHAIEMDKKMGAGQPPDNKVLKVSTVEDGISIETMPISPPRPSMLRQPGFPGDPSLPQPVVAPPAPDAGSHPCQPESKPRKSARANKGPKAPRKSTSSDSLKPQ